MLRSHTCDLDRCSVFKQFCTEFEQKRNNPEAFTHLLLRIAESDQSVWAVARTASRKKPLNVAERAMIAQIVAPHLAWKTPGSVYRRLELAKY